MDFDLTFQGVTLASMSIIGEGKAFWQPHARLCRTCYLPVVPFVRFDVPRGTREQWDLLPSMRFVRSVRVKLFASGLV